MRKCKRILAAAMALWCLLPFSVSANEALSLYAQSAVLMDADTGRVLYGKEEDMVRPMASTTKIMTCILVLESGMLQKTATVSEKAAAQPKVKLGACVGEQFLVEDLLYSLMLESHNDTAVILAEAVSKTTEAFAEKMNLKAEEIGCRQTHFVTPNGLDAKDSGGIHATTAEDLGRILCYCIENSPQKQAFLEITRTASKTFYDVSRTHAYSCSNHNAYLSMDADALTGKTGFTCDAGYCYVGAIESKGRTYVMALLGCGWPGNKGYKWRDMKNLADYGRREYQLKKVTFQLGTLQLPVKNGDNDMMTLTPVTTRKAPETVLMKKEEILETVTNIPCVLSSSIKAETLIGSRQLFLERTLLAEDLIIASEDVPKSA